MTYKEFIENYVKIKTKYKEKSIKLTHTQCAIKIELNIENIDILNYEKGTD